MRPELEGIARALETQSLPHDFEDLLGPAWNPSEQKFAAQETYILDFKDRIPESFTEDYGSSLCRLAAAFHNSYGGVIVIGVLDREQTLLGINGTFPIERFNNILSEAFESDIECLTQNYTVLDKTICVVLVPKRTSGAPIALKRAIGQYKSGMMWLRDRHQVKQAEARHLPILFSSRTQLPTDADARQKSIQRALPPPPATMHEFVGRAAIMERLWQWFTFGSQPRLYLHGPGGSGKSTIAYEFARTLSDVGFDVILADGSRVDYVIFITGKETELDPLSGRIKAFGLRQFTDALSQYREILTGAAGLNADELPSDADDAVEKVGDIFDVYSGLIVLDDIDALARKGEDTGEESLLLKAVLGHRRTRILYTLRNAASHAKKSSIAVPGLEGPEFFDFVDKCCKQFEVPPPTAEQAIAIETATSALPLLVEDVIGLRKHSSSFRDAIDQFKGKGGEEARRYLYQREYDGLDDHGRSRDVLACLSYVPAPLSFQTIVDVLAFSAEQVRDALSECSGIFLATEPADSGDTLYTVTPSSRTFLVEVSNKLVKSEQIKKKVEWLIRDHGQSTPEETAFIARLEILVKRDDWEGALAAAETVSGDDPIMANPRVLALVGQACANLEGAHRDRARQCFRNASALKFRDVHMMRAWFYLERKSGYGLNEASRIAREVVESKGAAPRVRSEFLSKLGDCLVTEARALQGVSAEKAMPLYRSAISAYSNSIYIGKKDRYFDTARNAEWLESVISSYARFISDNLDEYLACLDVMDYSHDIDMEAAEIIIRGVRRLRIRVVKENRQKIAGILSRWIRKLDVATKPLTTSPGFDSIVDALTETRTLIDKAD